MEERIVCAIMAQVNELSNIEGLNYQKIESELAIAVLKEIQKYNNTAAIQDAIEDIKMCI